MPAKKNYQESTSKSARVGKKEEGFQASADLDRIIPLAGGDYAYILDPRDGRTHHLRVGSDRWFTLMHDLLNLPTHASKLQTELDRLGWDGLDEPLPQSILNAVAEMDPIVIEPHGYPET